jgi:hypothetical protein
MSCGLGQSVVGANHATARASRQTPARSVATQPNREKCRKKPNDSILWATTQQIFVLPDKTELES